MATREELLASAKRKRLLAQANAVRTAVVDTDATPDVVQPKIVQEPEQPGILSRSMDTLRQGASDVMSTMAGDSYGRRSDDPTQRDALGLPAVMENLKSGDPTGAYGAMLDTGVTNTADAARAVFDVAGDALVSGAQTIAPETTAKAGSALAGAMDKFTNSQLGQDLSQLDARLTQQYPEQHKRAKDVATVTGAFTPGPKLGGPSPSGALTKALAKVDDKVKSRTSRQMLTPDNPYQKGYGDVTLEGATKTKTYNPSDVEARRIAAAEAVPGFDPSKPYSENVVPMRTEVARLKEQLDTDVAARGKPVSRDTIDDAVDQVMLEIADVATLTGDAQQVASNIVLKFQKLVDEATDGGSITPAALMQARRDLDNWLRKNNTKAFDPESEKALQVATQNIRRRVNELVHDATPDVDVAGSLQRQSDLLSTLDEIVLPRADTERPTRLGRYVQNLERTTGVRHTTTPYSIVQTTSNPAAALLLPVLAGAIGLKRGAGKGVRANTAKAAQLAEGILRNTPQVAARAGALPAYSQEEEQY